MTGFQRDALKAHGYEVGATCAQDKDPPELCPALSLPDLFRSGTPAQQASVRALLDAVPPYFSQAVINEDRTTATLAFGIRLMSLERQKKVIDDIERRLDPPEGVTASVVGLPVLAAEANDALADPLRRFLTLLAGLLLVFTVLRLVRRSTREAAIPLIPIALATGWSALVLFLLRIPLNPMSAVMGALVIAISTEFSVLLSARYREERDGGAEPKEAIDATYASTGAAVLASGTTAIMGFAALIASDIRMLRDFGLVTVVDLSVSLLGVMVVLPAALLWAEGRQFGLRDLDPRGWWRAIREEFSGLRLPRGRPSLPRPRLPRPRRSRDSEDRFGDLGPREPSAAERFAELDERDMEEERRERERTGPPRPTGRYTWVVGVAALLGGDRRGVQLPSERRAGLSRAEGGGARARVRRATRHRRRGWRHEHQAGSQGRLGGERHSGVCRARRGHLQPVRALQREAGRARPRRPVRRVRAGARGGRAAE